MRIGLVSPLATPTRRHSSGSIENVVWALGEELCRKGHDVTVFGAPGSETSGRLMVTVPGTYGEGGAPDDWQLCEWMNLAAAARHADELDVLHSHVYLWGVPLAPLRKTPVLHTTHVMPGEDDARLLDAFPGAHVSGISHFQWSEFPRFDPPVVNNGVDPQEFGFGPEHAGYLCFLGRFNTQKAPLVAISTARRLGMPIKLAGPWSPYLEGCVLPETDGHDVEYVGSVTGDDRRKLLSEAAALLYPLNEPEPFGLVLVEAMMSGTPVAATTIGAVPEIVDEGVTGYLAADAADLAAAVIRAVDLDRAHVRDRALARFAAEAMASGYLALYEQIVAGGRISR